MLKSLIDLACDTGFLYVDWRMIVMWGVVAVLMYLAVFKEFEPLLLVPIAFGALLANLPTEGVLNKPAEALIAPVEGKLTNLFVSDGGKVFVPRVVKHLPSCVSDVIAEDGVSQAAAQAQVAEYFNSVEDITSAEGRKDTFKKAKGIPDLVAIVRPSNPTFKTDKERAEADMTFTVPFAGRQVELRGSDVFVWAQASGDITDIMASVGENLSCGQKIVDVYSARTGGLYYYLQMGVLLEIFPPLIFLGVGALTDFGPLIARPKTLLWAARRSSACSRHSSGRFTSGSLRRKRRLSASSAARTARPPFSSPTSSPRTFSRPSRLRRTAIWRWFRLSSRPSCAF